MNVQCYNLQQKVCVCGIFFALTHTDFQGKIHFKYQEDNDDFITDYLLRRQCVQYIMPRHVESMHLRDDLDHDEEHDEVGVKDDDGGLNFRSGNNNNINVDEW